MLTSIYMTRQDIIRHFIRVIGPKCEMLEIGVDYGDTWHHQRGLLVNYTGVDVSLAKVRGDKEDPRSHWYEMESKEFWWLIKSGRPEHLCGRKWNLIYVDGDHGLDAVREDLSNAIEHLAVGGYLLAHDVDIPENGPAMAWHEVCVPDPRLQCWMIEPDMHPLGMGVAKKVKE